MDRDNVIKPAGEWFDNSKQLLENIGTLYNNPEISDLILHVGKQTYYAHRVLLAMASDVFKVMLTSKTWKDSSQEEICLEEPCSEGVFGEFLKYMYTGHIYITSGSAAPLLMLADKYNVTNLKESCESFMMRSFVSSPQQNHVLSWYQYAKQCAQHSQLESTCFEFIQNNLDVIMESPGWVDLDKETLLLIVKSSDIIISSEYKLYNAVERWLEHQSNIHNTRQNLREILPHVRFPMMTPEQLITIEKRKVVVENWFLYMEHMMKAYRFHAVSQGARQRAELEEDGEEYSHRNYTESEHGVCLPINIPNYSKRKPFEYSCHVETAKTGSSVDRSSKHRWDLQFWPKGQQKPALTEFGNAYVLQTEDVTLALNPLGRMEETFQIVVAIQGSKNGITYIKDAYRCTHDFSVKMKFRIRNMFSLSELMDGNSQYLHNDGLVVRLIVRPCKSQR